jgi:hypothetical protein
LAPTLLLEENFPLRLLVKVDGVDAMIVGYVAVEARVHAIVVMNGALSAIDLELISFHDRSLPKSLQKRIRRHRKRDQKFDVQTTSEALAAKAFVTNKLQ